MFLLGQKSLKLPNFRLWWYFVTWKRQKLKVIRTWSGFFELVWFCLFLVFEGKRWKLGLGRWRGSKGSPESVPYRTWPSVPYHQCVPRRRYHPSLTVTRRVRKHQSTQKCKFYGKIFISEWLNNLNDQVNRKLTNGPIVWSYVQVVYVRRDFYDVSNSRTRISDVIKVAVPKKRVHLWW